MLYEPCALGQSSRLLCVAGSHPTDWVSHFVHITEELGLNLRELLWSTNWSIASDCSGLDAFVVGLDMFREQFPELLRFRHISSCDIWPIARQWIKAVHKPDLQSLHPSM